MTTLSLAMIVKDEGDTIDRVLACAAGFCDEMVVVDTGSSDDTVARATARGARVHHFRWVDDFAAARNFAFSQCSGEWILWLDGDDVISPADQQRIAALKAHALDASIDVAFFRYATESLQLRRERLIRRALFGTTLTWKYRVHECIAGIDLARARFFDDVCITHATPPGRQARKAFRNLNILRAQFQSGDRDPHVVYHYLIECLGAELHEEAAEAFEAFTQSDQPDFKRRQVYCRMADRHLAAGQHRLAEHCLAQAIAAGPARAEGYFKMGAYVLNQLRQPQAAVALLTVASQMSVEVGGLPDPAAYGSGPLELLARAHVCLEDLPQAQAAARQAIERGAAPSAWLTDLLSCDPDRPVPPLPGTWSDWIDQCLAVDGAPADILQTLLDRGLFASAALAGLAAGRRRR